MLLLFSALMEGLVWSLLWSIFVFVLIFRYPWLIEHDYPPDIRQAAQIPAPTPNQKRQGLIFTFFAYLVLLGTLMAAGLVHYNSTPVSFGTLFFHMFILCFSWNVFDLLVLDWLLVCTLTPRWLILPGTAHCTGYKNYRFHFTGFLKGCVYMTLFALVFAGIDYLILRLFVW